MPSVLAYGIVIVDVGEMYTPHLYSTPPYGRLRPNFAKMFSTGKTRMIGLLKKVCRAISVQCRNVIDRHTHTDRIAVLTCDKKWDTS